MGNLISGSIDSIIDEHINKFKIPYCTFGVDRRLLEEIEAVNQHSKVLGQNSANFSIMDKIKRFVCRVYVTLYDKLGWIGLRFKI